MTRHQPLPFSPLASTALEAVHTSLDALIWKSNLFPRGEAEKEPPNKSGGHAKFKQNHDPQKIKPPKQALKSLIICFENKFTQFKFNIYD